MVNALKIEFDELKFVQTFKQICLSSSSPIIIDLLNTLKICIEDAKPDNLNYIKYKFSEDIQKSYRDQSESIPFYSKNGLSIWYTDIEVSYSLDSEPYTDLILPSFLNLESIKYGQGIEKKIKLKNSKLKTIQKSKFNLMHLAFKPIFFSSLNLTNYETLIPSKLDVYEWRQTFYNKVTGEEFLCECFRKAIEKDQPINSRSERVRKAVSNSSYKKNICHICTKENSDLFFSSTMYGSIFYMRYGAYINKISIEKDIDLKTAENLVREIKNVPKIGEKWINETLLFNHIDFLFPNKALREASPEWLGRQRLDIYIPDLNLAIEYQGEQHFKAIKHFGGSEALEKTKERDKLKAKLCKKNKINLIYFTFKENLSESLIKTKLKKYITKE